jgi:5-methylcytosine-specific restriction endonuclease McrA
MISSHNHNVHEHLDYDAVRVCNIDASVSGGNVVFTREIREGPSIPFYGASIATRLIPHHDFRDAMQEYTKALAPRLKTSKYNAKKAVCAFCQVCGLPRSDVHHIAEQASANDAMIIQGTGMHKNVDSNLVVLCKKCHVAVHEGRLRVSYQDTLEGKSVHARWINKNDS